MKRFRLVFPMLLLFVLLATTASAVEVDLGGHAPLALNVLSASGNQITVAVEVGSFKLMPEKNRFGDKFYRIALPNAGVLPIIGQPELPVISRLVQLPAAGGVNLQVISVDTRTVDLNEIGHGYQLWPTQAPINKVPGARENAPFDFDQAAYSSRGFAGPATHVGPVQVMRGMRFARLSIAPISYDPVANQLKVATRTVVRIDFDQATETVGNISHPVYRSPAFEALAEGMFINYSASRAATDDPSVPEPPVPGGYLIISAPAFVDNVDLLDLAAWKAEKGYDVTVVSTDDTGTTKEDIQSYIQTAYESWAIPPAYVLFVGDTDTIPYWYVDEVSDIYYAAIDGDDYFADLFYARFPVRTADQLANMVAKTLEYEMGAWADPQYFLNITWMASNDNYSVSEGTHNYVIDTWTDPAGFTSNKRYNHSGATTQQVLDDIEAGLNYLIYSGHGSEHSWADGPAVSESQVEGLENTVYPYVASHSCLTGSYDLDECFAETWVRGEHGAVMFWGASTYTQWTEDDVLERRYFDGIFDPALPRNYTTFGEFTIYGMVKLYEHFSGGGITQEYFEKYNIMGDASVDLWTGQPSALSVTHAPVIFFGSTTYPVQVAGEEGALVGFSLDGEFIASALTDGTGAATLSWTDPIATAGTYTLTVTQHDRLPYQGDVLATTASSNGMVMASPELVGDDATISIMVADADLMSAGTMTVEVSSDAEPTPEVVTLTEVAPDSGAFSGTIVTNAVVEGNGLIEIQEGDTVVVDYYDEDTGSGPAHKTVDIEVDLTPPTFAGVEGQESSDRQVVIDWSTATEPHGPVTYQIYRAETSGGQNFESPIGQTTELTYTDTDLTNNQSYFYVVRATDALGNQDSNTAEVEGLPVGPNLIFSEDWETDALGDWTIENGGGGYTWTTNDECGQCGSSLFEGVYIMADSDCAGWLSNMTEQLISPSVDCSDWHGVFLRFANYIHHMGEQYCRVYVSIDQAEWELLVEWREDKEEITDVDLSEYADGEADVRVRFEYHGEYDWWWSLDNVEILGYEGAPIPDDDTVDDDTVDDDTVDDDTVDDDTVDDDTADDDTVDDDTVDDDTTDDDTTDDDTTDDDTGDDDTGDDDVTDDDVTDDDVTDDDISPPGSDDDDDDDTAPLPGDDDDDDDGCGC